MTADPLRVEIFVITPVFRNLVSPYFPTELGPVKPVHEKSFYFTNRFGDVLPTDPAVKKGFRYYVRWIPWPATLSPLPATARRGVHPDESHLDNPSPDEVGVDLVRLAREHQLDQGSIQEKIEKLRVFCTQNFRYNDTATWRGDT